jgi:HK97 gp10 family phage protein
MANDVSCSIEGLDGIEELLQIVYPAQAKTAVRTAGRKAGKIWQEAVEEKAPRDTGFLADHINVSTQAGEGDDNSTGSIAVVVAPARQAFYAMFQEFGTKNQPAKPFVQPAYEEHKEEALEVFANELLKALDKLAK